MQMRERGVLRNIDGSRVINIFRDLNHKLDLQTNLPANSCFRDSRARSSSHGVCGYHTFLGTSSPVSRAEGIPTLVSTTSVRDENAKSKETGKKESRLPSGKLRFCPDVFPRFISPIEGLPTACTEKRTSENKNDGLCSMT